MIVKGNTSEIRSYYSLIVSRFLSWIQWFNKGLLHYWRRKTKISDRFFFRQPWVPWESKPIFICLWEHMLSKTIRSQYFIIFLPCNQCLNNVCCIKNTSFPKRLALFANCMKRLGSALIIQFASIHSLTCWLNVIQQTLFYSGSETNHKILDTVSSNKISKKRNLHRNHLRQFHQQYLVQ